MSVQDEHATHSHGTAGGSTAHPSPAELEQICLELAAGAASLVRSQRESALAAGDVTSKSTPTDLVTEVDRASERWLSEQIMLARPHDAILGEEDGERPGTTGLRWVLDPIDGTVNFVLGIPYYAVSVAVECDGEVVAGAVINPVSGERFHAHLGGGAWLGTQRLSGPRTVPLERAVVGTGFSYDRAMRTRQVQAAAQVAARVADLRRLGSAALDLCFLAAGRLDAYFEAGLYPWDHAAGGLIAQQAGCVLSGLAGAPSHRMYAACGVELAPEFFEMLTATGVTEVWPEP